MADFPFLIGIRALSPAGDWVTCQHLIWHLEAGGTLILLANARALDLAASHNGRLSSVPVVFVV